MHEKMSKSKGNSISVDEVVRGVAQVAPGFVLHDEHGRVVRPQDVGAWRGLYGMYYEAARFGGKPLFLNYDDDNPVPPLLCGEVQHPKSKFWEIVLDT